MSSSAPFLGRRGSCAAFLDQRLAAGRVSFSLAELLRETRLSRIAARRQLIRLTPRVARVSPRQAFFVIVGPEHRANGAPPATWWLDDYFAWVGRPYYVALHSAADLYEPSSQALQVVQVMTDRPRRGLHIGRIRIQFFVKRRISRTLIQPLTNAFAPLRVSTPEETAFDLVRYAPRVGGMERVRDVLASLFPLLDPGALRKTLVIENDPSTAQRLGYLADHVGVKALARTVRDWLPRSVPYIPLIPGSSVARAIKVERWRIVIA